MTTTSQVHISDIKAGDTVMHGGHMKTVSGNNIKRDTFMGTSIFGDSYRSGHDKVTKVTFMVPTNKGIRQE